MFNPPPSDWFAHLAAAEVDALHRHVRLVYPLAPTEETVREAFRRASQGAKSAPPTPRAWLRRLARECVLDIAAATPRWPELNAEMIRLEIRDVADSAERPSVREVGIDLADRLADVRADQLEVLRMLALEDLATDELAHVVGVPVADAAALVSAAERRLRDLFEQSDETERDQ